MKPFRFRLQTVLEHRKQLETQAQLHHVEAQQVLASGEKLLGELNEVRAAILAELSERRNSRNLDPEETRLYTEYLMTVVKCIKDQEVYLSDVRCNVEAHRIHLVGTSQKRQIMTKMHERAHTAHKAISRKAEQITQDEIASRVRSSSR